ncbi:Bug family tripartite tricarboxylate transporter substrate binding protein [Cupriavidus metallidurans]|uniref:Bug family tripartite tricarboxylate transporter substrate binding protein n=1 Tax=Cupriavidus metallidurans TaxID=119219 RepID=UPI000564C4F1
MGDSPVRTLCLFALLLIGGVQTAHAAQAETPQPRCIAPARPGGGYDLTCRIAKLGLDEARALPARLQIDYRPGGIGAVMFDAVVEQTPDDANTIVAFSSGALLNLASGRFSKYGPDNVKWLVAIGVDHGMIAVDARSPYLTLKDLVTAMKADPRKVLFGIGGSAGSQDWMKATLLARQAGLDRNAMRYVAFEGGGEAMTALMTGHVQAVPGDIGEAVDLIEAHKIRVLAVLADQRLPGRFASIPTAKEQGLDVQWPIVRGFYMGPKVAEHDLRRWGNALQRAAGTRAYVQALETHGIVPTPMAGPELDTYVQNKVREYRRLAREFDLIK